MQEELNISAEQYDSTVAAAWPGFSGDWKGLNRIMLCGDGDTGNADMDSRDMRRRKIMLPIRFLSKRLLASAMLLALTAAAQAQSDAGAPATSGIPPCPYMAPHMQGQGMGMGPGMMEWGFMGQGMGMPMAPWMGQFHGNAMMPGMGYGHAFLNGLNLNEEQQDRVFNILHKQAPRQRDSMKLLNKSMTALHELARSGNYSDANAQSIARSIGQASADLALMHAQTERQIMEILTPEQRRLIEERGFGARGRPGASGPGAMAPRR